MEMNSILTILQNGGDFNTVINGSYKSVCDETLERISAVLEALDQAIRESRDKKKYKYVDIRKRTMMLKFGNLHFKRSYYYEEKDIDGNKVKVYHYLLDEMLGIPERKKVYPDIVYEGVENAATMPFGEAAKEAGDGDGITISHTTVWKKTKEVGGIKAQGEIRDVDSVLENGATVEGENRKAATLFTEADGVWVSLQGKDRENYGQGRRKKTEVKLFVCHEGWKNRYPGSNQFSTINKWCHAGYEKPEIFWEKIGLEVARRYDLSKVQHTILNADGAKWAKKGIDYLANGIYQLDRFHRNRALVRVFGKDFETVKKIKECIDKDDYNSMYNLINSKIDQQPDEKKKESIAKLKKYFENNQEGLKDYRERGLNIQYKEPRGMGTAEPNIDKILANRLKKKGISWSIDGVNSMCKILQMKENGELYAYLRSCFEGTATSNITVMSNLVDKAKKHLNIPHYSDRNIHMAILDGPRKGWIKAIKDLIALRAS